MTENTVSNWQRWLLKPSVLPLARTFVVLVCLSLVATDGWLIWTSRNIQLRDAEVETSNLASALARQATDTLKKADTVLIGMVERLQADGADRARLQALMRQQVYALPELHGLFAYDRDGNWLISSFEHIPPGANNADREYFIFHRDHPGDYGSHIGLPIQSRTNGEWVIPVSRRLEDAKG